MPTYQTYQNGYIPDDLLITFETGHNSTDGDWKHQLSPGTLAKWRALVELAKQHTGKTLTLHDGWSAYRPYRIQVLAKQMFGKGAAAPGQSSHGGFWENRQTLAMDVGNWEWVYGTREKFYADVRAVGLEPGLIRPDRGYPDEPWHIIDYSPWAPAPAGTGSTPFDQIQEDPDMYAIQLNDTDDSGVIIAPGVPPMSRPRQVFDAMCSGLGLRKVTLGGPDQFKYDTIIREQWSDASRVAALTAAGIQKAQNPTATVDVQAIAKAVNDDAAKRLAG